MFLTSPETDTRRRRAWSLKTTVASLGAMMLTSAGLALLPATAAAAASDIPSLEAALTQAQADAAEALTAYQSAEEDHGEAEKAITKAQRAVDRAQGDVDKATKKGTDPAAPTLALEAATAALTAAMKARDDVPGGTQDLLTAAKQRLDTANQAVITAKATLDTARAAVVPTDPPPAESDGLGAGDGDQTGGAGDGAGAGDPGGNKAGEDGVVTTPNDTEADEEGEDKGEGKGKGKDKDKGTDPRCDEPPAVSGSGLTELPGDDKRDKKCEENGNEENGNGGYNGACDREPDMRALDAEATDETREDWEKKCYTEPKVEIDVTNRCPTVVTVTIDNLKRWLDYRVKINGEWTDLEVKRGKAVIEVTDFESGRFKVKVEYEKKWKDDHEKGGDSKGKGHGGRVEEQKWIDDYKCPVIKTEVKKACDKIDGNAKVKLVVSRLDENRKYLVTVEGDDYKEHFIVRDTRRFVENLKLEEGDYTVTVESWDKNGGGYENGGLSLESGGGNGGYDKFDVGPVEYEFEVDGCPVDVTVEPTENCEAITAVLDTLVEGREYIVKVKDSEGDVVFEKTVWGPTTLDQKFQQDTYTVIVIDVKARDEGDREGGWDDSDTPWKDKEQDEVVLSAVVGDEFSYDKGWGKDDGGDRDSDDRGDRDDRGKKGKGLKWTATITISDCEEPPSVEPAGDTPDEADGGNGVSVSGSGGGVLATTGADPAGLALAALILLPVGGAALATRSVIARRKNAA